MSERILVRVYKKATYSAYNGRGVALTVLYTKLGVDYGEYRKHMAGRRQLWRPVDIAEWVLYKRTNAEIRDNPDASRLLRIRVDNTCQVGVKAIVEKLLER